MVSVMSFFPCRVGGVGDRGSEVHIAALSMDFTVKSMVSSMVHMHLQSSVGPAMGA